MGGGLQSQMNWQQKRNNRLPPIGLKNLGNSCYLNSVLQCLTYTPPLANFCLKRLHSSLCDSATEPDRKRDCPFCILEKRIVRSLSIDLTLDAPAKIVNCLRLFSEHFKSGRQEDAHEFLRYVIDACHNTCLRLKKLQQQYNRKGLNGGRGETFDGITIVKEIFGGALQSQVKCLSCGSESNKVDEIMDISLEISQTHSLKEAMKRFFQAEILDGNNKYKCERCKKLAPAKKQMSMLQAPNVLVVQLKRFEGIFGRKIDRVIAFEEVLVLSSFMCKESQDIHPEYSLFATIVHSGFSPESGHYYAYIKDAMGCWYCCNDSFVTLSTLQEVLSEKAYVLFFMRTNPMTASANTAAVSNGVRPHKSNKNNTFNGSENAISAKAVNTRSSNSPPIVGGIQVASKVGVASGTLQNKFTGLAFALSKKVSVSSNGKTDVKKRESGESNGNKCHSVCEQMIAKSVSSLENNNNGNADGNKNAVESNYSMVNGNGHLLNGIISAANGDLQHVNGIKDTLNAGKKLGNGSCHVGETNGHVDSSRSKRKLEDRDSCILLTEDVQSRSRVEELKKVLYKEAVSVLQSCGWSDMVYKYMRSRKRMCLDGHVSDNNEPKRMLIADAKATFLSQIPGSLKGSLIESIRSFSRE